jgi:hypothetical protein
MLHWLLCNSTSAQSRRPQQLPRNFAPPYPSHYGAADQDMNSARAQKQAYVMVKQVRAVASKATIGQTPDMRCVDALQTCIAQLLRRLSLLCRTASAPPTRCGGGCWLEAVQGRACTHAHCGLACLCSQPPCQTVRASQTECYMNARQVYSVKHQYKLSRQEWCCTRVPWPGLATPHTFNERVLPGNLAASRQLPHPLQ